MRLPSLRTPGFIAATLLLVSVPETGLAQDAPGYQVPDPSIVRIVDADPTPAVSLSPDDARMLLVAGAQQWLNEHVKNASAETTAMHEGAGSE